MRHSKRPSMILCRSSKNILTQFACLIPWYLVSQHFSAGKRWSSMAQLLFVRRQGNRGRSKVGGTLATVWHARNGVGKHSTRVGFVQLECARQCGGIGDELLEWRTYSFQISSVSKCFLLTRVHVHRSLVYTRQEYVVVDCGRMRATHWHPGWRHGSGDRLFSAARMRAVHRVESAEGIASRLTRRSGFRYCQQFGRGK